MDDLIREMAEKHDMDAALLRELLEWEQARVHFKKRRNLIKDLRRILESHALEEQP